MKLIWSRCVNRSDRNWDMSVANPRWGVALGSSECPEFIWRLWNIVNPQNRTWITL